MLDLLHLQKKTARALLNGEITAIAGEFSVKNADPARRLSIFSNNTFSSLTAVLKSVFPVTARLADDRFFDYAAHAFIAAEPPREARLSQYGATFPRFLAKFPPCCGFPIIAQMAGLEWAIVSSLNAAEEPPAPVSMLEHLHRAGGKARLHLRPNLYFTISRWNLISVWIDHKASGGKSLRPLERRTSRIAVMRHGEDIQFLSLEPARFAFWRTLAGGMTLEQAMSRAVAREPLFDLVSETLLLFRAGLVTGIGFPAMNH